VVTQTVAPAPQPVVPAPQPVVPAPQPVAPAPAPVPEPQAPRTQVGDLVPAGTEGLTPAHITRQALATYPPIARMQRIQGSVIISALINENGQVIDTRILTTASSLLNDAAVNSVRRSTFTPGSKDGVRVKSWTPVRVDFKL
jgi:TonB family protein